MGHLSATKTRTERTPREWLPLGAQIGEFANDKSGRGDIVCFIGENAGQGAPACWVPAEAELEMDLAIAFRDGVTPAEIGDFRLRSSHFEWPRATGALIHEVSHSKWTLWPLEFMGEYAGRDHLRKLTMNIVEMLEEIRIEYNGVREWPRDRGFLRRSALDIVIGDLDVTKLKEGNSFELSRLLILTLGRVVAGVLDPDDIEELTELLAEFFGAPLLLEFDSLMKRAVRVWHHEQAHLELTPIAEEWMKLLPEDPDGAGAMAEAMKEWLESLEEMLGDAGITIEIGSNDELGEQESTERGEAQVESRNNDSREEKQHEKMADKVFEKGISDRPEGATNSRVKTRRPPTDEERRAALTVGRALEKARYIDRVETKVRSEMPPGRLKTREAITAAAQEFNGGTVTALPWATVVRKHVQDPTLRVGVMVDISGSMSGAMVPMAVTAWMLSEACHRIQASAAMVYYGESVFPTLIPGQRMPEVVVRTAADGTEKFDRAFQAIDGKLGLLHGSGARLLVICSDTQYTPDEVVACKKWVNRCVAAGVGVLILPYDGGHHVRRKGFGPAVQVIPGSMDPAAAATVIGQAAVKAIEAAGDKR